MCTRFPALTAESGQKPRLSPFCGSQADGSTGEYRGAVLADLAGLEEPAKLGWINPALIAARPLNCLRSYKTPT
jgi:hypothetical protein